MTTERTPRPLPGKHPAVLRHVQLQAPQDASWAPQVVMSFELIPPDEEAGMFTSYFGSLSEEANDKGNRPIDWTINALRACGWTGDDLSELPALAEDDKLTQIIELVTEHKRTKAGANGEPGKLISVVKFVNRPGSGGKIKIERAMEGDELKDFGRRFRTSVSAAGTQTKKPAAPAAARPQPRAAPTRGQQRQDYPVVDDGMPPLGDTPPPEDDYLR